MTDSDCNKQIWPVISEFDVTHYESPSKIDHRVKNTHVDWKR